MSDLAGEARALLVRLGAGTGADEAPLAELAARVAAAADAASGDARREARRLLYRLRQHGVALPEPALDVTPAAPLGPSIEAFVSAVDGRGDRLMWLVRERADGGITLVAADVNEPAGLRDVRLVDATRKQLRTMRERFREAGVRLVPADWRRVDALVVEAQARAGAPASRQRDYGHLRTRLTSLPPLAPAELVSTHVAAPGPAERDALVAASATLLAEPELRGWWPSPETAEPFLAEIAGIRESPLVLSEAQQEARLRALLAGAVTTLYPQATTARRLRAVAYVLAETGRADAARHALAVAAALEDAPDRAPGVPLLQTLVHQGLGARLAAREGERRETRADSLVVTPAEAATARSPSRPPRARA